MPRNEVSKLAKHSVETDEFTYSTIESNIARQNTLYSEEMIGKKVDVIIEEGVNKGETLIGTVQRSLKPNRHAFGKRPGLAYVIIFDKDENGGKIESDEMTNIIPNQDEGITMHVGPVRGSRSRTTPVPVQIQHNSNSKKKGKKGKKTKKKKGKKRL